MKKKAIIIVIIVVVIVLAVSSWIIYKKFFKSNTDTGDLLGEGEDEPPVTYGGGGGGYAPSSFPIQKGMSGPQVIAVQDSINKKCNAGLVTDGKFGPKTETALKSCYGTATVSQALFSQMTATGGINPGIVTGFSSGQRVFLKGNVANLYSYPSFATNYIVGSVEKSFFLDKAIGQYVSPATGGFAKIKVFGYKPYGATQYKVEAREVYVSTQALSKTAY